MPLQHAGFGISFQWTPGTKGPFFTFWKNLCLWRYCSRDAKFLYSRGFMLLCEIYIHIFFFLILFLQSCGLDARTYMFLAPPTTPSALCCFKMSLKEMWLKLIHTRERWERYLSRSQWYLDAVSNPLDIFLF